MLGTGRLLLRAGSWLLFAWPQQGRQLLGHIDPDRAPGNASAAADAAGRAELIDPRRKLMRQPHAVPILGCLANILPVDIPVLLCEAGIPQSGMCGVLMREVRRLLDLMAEAGRADHRTVRASQATYRHIVPARMLMGSVEGLRQARTIYSSDLVPGTSIHARCRFTDYFVCSGRQRESRKKIHPSLALGFDQELIIDLGQSKIESALGARASLHGCTKTGAQRPGAVHRDHEEPFTACCVVRITVDIFEKDPVLDDQACEIARASTDDSHFLRVGKRRASRESIPTPLNLYKRFTRRECEGFQRLRPMNDPEDFIGAGLFQPITSRLLMIAPADREI